MKRLAVLIGLLVVFTSGYALATQAGPSGAVAQDQRTLTVQAKFRPTDYEGEKVDLSQGEVCSYTNAYSEIWPISKQVVISDAAGVIVGTVDLVDIFNVNTYPLPDEAQLGIVNRGGLCVVSKTLAVEDSAFYTFTIEGEYRWTVSREELAEHDWSILVDFYEDTTI